MYKSADTKSEVLKKVGSGTKVNLIERKGYLAHVELPNGTRGWVKHTFLTEEEPARAKLNALQAKVDKASQASENHAHTLTEKASQIQKLEETITEMREQTENAIAARDILAAENSALSGRLSQYSGAVPSQWVWISGLLSLLAGALGTYFAIDYLARKRHGGFKVY